jgi:hypothetical protein
MPSGKQDVDFGPGFYGDEIRVPMWMQREILHLNEIGYTPSEIRIALKETGINIQTVMMMLKRGVISPRRCEPRRCPGCGIKVVSEACLACEVRRICCV